jgi:hypothetical protein
MWYLRFLVSAMVKLRSAHFWVVMHCMLVNVYGCFGTAYLFHLCEMLDLGNGATKQSWNIGKVLPTYTMNNTEERILIRRRVSYWPLVKLIISVLLYSKEVQNETIQLRFFKLAECSLILAPQVVMDKQDNVIRDNKCQWLFIMALLSGTVRVMEWHVYSVNVQYNCDRCGQALTRRHFTLCKKHSVYVGEYSKDNWTHTRIHFSITRLESA